MQPKKLTEEKRNTSLDFLRIVSMIMVLLLHYIGKGSLLDKNNVDEIMYVIYYIIEALSIVAVNCYILISGYFLVKSEFKVKKLLKIWVEVVFYSISIYIILIILNIEEFNIIKVIKSCFPVITNQYWFVTSYIALYVLSPFINKLIYALDKKEYKTLLIILFIMFSVFSILPSEMSLDKTGGYGIIWFVCLYLIAAYIRLYINDEFLKKHRNKFIVMYLLTGLITTIGILLIKNIVTKFGIKDISFKLLAYNVPNVLIASICLFLYFKTIKIKNKYLNKLILQIAPLTFAVYVIHEQPILRKILYTDILHTEICYNNPYGILIVLSSIIVIFSICTLIEYIRVNILKLIKNKVNLLD